MNNNRLINLGIVAGIVIVALAGWFMGIAPINDQVTAARAQEQTIVTANSTSASRLGVLKKQFSNLGELQAQLGELSASVPADAAVPSFLAELNAVTGATGTTLINLSVSSAAIYVAPVTPTAATPASTDSTATPSATPTAATAPTATTPASAGPTARLVAVPVKILVSGSYSAVMAFSAAVQGGTRLLYVSNLTLTQSTTDASFTGSIDGVIYALPAAGGVTTPTPTKTPAPSATPTPSSTVPANPSGTPTSTPTPTGTAKP